VPIDIFYKFTISSILHLTRNCSLQLKIIRPCTILNSPVTNAGRQW
jgi:hypothetical protein